MSGREHVKRFWSFQDRKAIGSSFILFANVYAVALVLTLINGYLLSISQLWIVALWFALFVIFAFALIVNVINAHIKAVRLMNYREHKEHSRNMGILLITMVIVVIVFLLPIIIFPSFGVLLLLFSIGGVVLALYLSFIFLFGYAYHSLVVAVAFLWAFFVMGLLALPLHSANLAVFNAVSLLVTSVAVIIAFSATGVMLLTEASNEFEKEVKKIAEGVRKR